MKKLYFGTRNLGAKYNKRVICNFNILLNVLNQAISEKIKAYMLIYFYNQEMYSVGYEINSNVMNYYLGLPDGSTKNFTSLDMLLNEAKYEHDVTVVREFQINPTDPVSSIGAGAGAVVAALFISKYEAGETGMIETSINDNFILKNYLVTSNNPNYNANLNMNQVNELNALAQQAAKDETKMIKFLVLCFVFAAGVIALAYVFGK